MPGAAREVLMVGVNRRLMLAGVKTVIPFCFLDRAFSIMKTKNKPTKCTN